MKPTTYCFILLLGFCNAMFSQSLSRGPYLQSNLSNSIIIMWRTSSATDTKVKVGTHPDSLNRIYPLGGLRTDHQIKVTDLLPYTKYYYTVGNSSADFFSADSLHSFVTAPVPGTQLPYRIWAIGDFGKGNAGQIATKRSYLTYTAGKHTDVWLWLGDNAYDDGTDGEYQSKVFRVSGFSDVFHFLPFWPCPGNHDYGSVWNESATGVPYVHKTSLFSSGNDLDLSEHEGPYYRIVEVPKEAEAGGKPTHHEVFYSFDYGNVHFLSLNSELYDALAVLGGTQTYIDSMIRWIRIDLSNNVQPFTMAYFHQPPYSKGSHDSDSPTELVMAQMRQKVVPVLESFDIDIVLCGHSHVYERSFLLNGHTGNSSSFNPSTMRKNGTDGNPDSGRAYIKDMNPDNDEGTVYVVCGNGGASESGADLDHPIFFYDEDNSNGSSIFDVYRNMLIGQYLRSDGSIRDKFAIIKKNMKLIPGRDTAVCYGKPVKLEIQFSGGSDSLEFDYGSGFTKNKYLIKTIGGTQNIVLKVRDMLSGQMLIDTIQIVCTSKEIKYETISKTACLYEVVAGVIIQKDTSIRKVTSGITGCDSIVKAYYITLDTVSKPNIIQMGGYLQSSVIGSRYEWYENGVLLAGKDSLMIWSKVGSTYMVRVHNERGCYSESLPFITDATTSNNLSATKRIHVVPNPSKGQFLILGLNDSEILQVAAIDSQGRQVLVNRVKGSNGSLFSVQARGQFMLQVESIYGMLREKVIIE